MREEIEQIIQSPKLAASVSAMTTTAGAGTVFDYIPDDIGKLATLIGIILSVILIRVHLAALKKIQLELKALQEKHKET